MEWSTKRVRVVVGDEEKIIIVANAEELKKKIIETAASHGLHRFVVLASGEFFGPVEVGPEELAEKFNDIELIEIQKLDIAG